MNNPNLLKIALQYVQDFDGLVIAFSQESNIKGNGVVNEGIVSTRLGLKGIPALAEELQIAQNLFVLEYTGGKLHIPTISTAKSAQLIREAKAKGLKNRTVIWKHGFKNALITIITVLCMQIPYLFSGALLTETIFIWPGIGRLNYDAVLNRDYPLIMGILMIVAIIIII